MPTPTSSLVPEALAHDVEQIWDASIVPELVEYIRIPNESPLFDPDWAAHGHMDRAVEHIARWCRERPIDGLTVEIVRLENRTPVILMEIPGDTDDTVLLYGHLDKQPPMAGWREDLGPWKPVLEGDKLYGRGGADDGYAAYASLTAIETLRRHGGQHARCVVLIEGCEESGSYDLPAYMEALEGRIGTPSLVVCLDSGCGNYDQLWCTTSLRGIVVGTLSIDILREGVHSGDASGVVPSSFRIARRLLSRLEDEPSGRILPAAFQAVVPEDRVAQARHAADVLGPAVWEKFPFVDGAGPVEPDPTRMVLARTWEAALSVTGVDGMPSLEQAGNVLRPGTSLRLSLRVPPTCDSTQAARELKALLEADPPYGAHVRFDVDMPGEGWNAAAPGAMARAGHRPRLADVLPAAGRAHGRGGLDPLHGHARGAVPAGPVPHHGRAGARLQRTRPQRVPAHSDGQAPDGVCGIRPGRARAPLSLLVSSRRHAPHRPASQWASAAWPAVCEVPGMWSKSLLVLGADDVGACPRAGCRAGQGGVGTTGRCPDGPRRRARVRGEHA